MTAEPSSDGRTSALVGIALVLVSSVGFGLNPLFARLAYDAGLSAEAATLYRFAIPALILLPALRAAFRWPALAGIAGAAGIFMGIGTAAYFRALEALPVALAALIYYTYPAFALLLGRVVFGETLGLRRSLAGALVVAGAAVAIGPASLAPEQLSAAALCFLAPLAYALLLNLLATTLAPMPVLPKTAAVLLGCCVATAPLALWTGGAVWPASPAGYGAIAALGLLGMLIPALLVTLGAPLAGAAATGVISGAELAVAMGSGWLFLDEPVRPTQLVGGGLVLGAALLAGISRQRLPRAAPH